MIICTVADQGLFVSLHVYRTHYANMPMYYAEIFKDVKMIIFSSKYFKFFLFLLKHRLWAHVRTASTACKPQFNNIKVGCKGVYITWTCYHDEQPKS